MAARIWLVYRIIGGAGVSSARIGAHMRAHMCAYARIPEIKKTDFAKSLRFSRKTIPGGGHSGTRARIGLRIPILLTGRSGRPHGLPAHT